MSAPQGAIDEILRVTKPYTESQWNAINALGNRIDHDLRASGTCG